MRSIRYKKLMEYRNRLHQGQPLEFQFLITNQIKCFLSFQSWNQEIFVDMEKGLSMRQLVDEFHEWIQLPPEMKGKRSHEIAIAKSNKYCLKFIKIQDFQVFQKFFPDYIEFKQKNQSILVPIYGILKMKNITSKLKWEDYIMFMPNLKRQNSVMYDIKGHCDNRIVNEQDFKDFCFGKDENFVNSKYIQLLQQLQTKQKEDILTLIKQNIHFLASLKLIDYSLLLIFAQHGNQAQKDYSKFNIVENYTLQIKIIDLFQTFNQKKRLESKFKSLFFKDVSSTDPDTYSKRMLDFMQKILFPK